MENVAKAAENVKLESERVGYDPATGTNWCHLPVEIRAECAKHMNFQSRINLRRTAVVEHGLAVSGKIPFHKVRITYGYPPAKEFSVIAVETVENTENDGSTALDWLDHSRPLSLLDNLLKFTQPKHLVIYAKQETEDEWDGILAMFHKYGPFVLSELRIVTSFPSVTQKILRECTSVGMIQFEEMRRAEGKRVTFDLEPFLDIPAVINADFLSVVTSFHRESLYELVRKWIECDMPIGHKFRFTEIIARCRAPIRHLGEEYSDRYTEGHKPLVSIRVHMNDKSKHILVGMCHGAIGVVVEASLPPCEEQSLLHRVSSTDFTV